MITYKLYNGLSAQELYALLGYKFDVSEKFLDKDEKLFQYLSGKDAANYKTASKQMYNCDETMCYDICADKTIQKFIAIELTGEKRDLDINAIEFEDGGMRVYKIYEGLDAQQLRELLDYNFNSPEEFYDEKDIDDWTKHYESLKSEIGKSGIKIEPEKFSGTDLTYLNSKLVDAYLDHSLYRTTYKHKSNFDGSRSYEIRTDMKCRYFYAKEDITEQEKNNLKN